MISRRVFLKNGGFALVSLGFAPSFLARTAFAAGRNGRAKQLIAIFQRGAVDDAVALVRQVKQLGMPLYQCQPPTGYKDTADVWINTGALVARMNVASRLAAGDQPLALQLGSPEFQRR